jgi:hypothetical protein
MKLIDHAMRHDLLWRVVLFGIVAGLAWVCRMLGLLAF